MFLDCSVLGLLRQPKWGHLKDVHKAIKLCEEAMVATDPKTTSLGSNLEVCTTETSKLILRRIYWLPLKRIIFSFLCHLCFNKAYVHNSISILFKNSCLRIKILAFLCFRPLYIKQIQESARLFLQTSAHNQMQR